MMSMIKRWMMNDLTRRNLPKKRENPITREEYRARRNARARYKRLKRRKRNLKIAVTIAMLFTILGIINRDEEKSTTNVEILQENESIEGDTININSIYGLNESENPVDMPEIIMNHLPINPISRPGKLIESVDHIVIHYVGNPGTTAAQNRSYYEEIIATMEASVSSNYLVGLEGEIIECIPSYEVAYASNHMNSYSISIEVSHPDDSGEFNNSTYRSMVELTAWLCGKYKLTSDDLLRHYDVTGKECPKSFVDKPEEWVQFKDDVAYILTQESD